MNATEMRFLCPHCRQKLACEDGYGGWQIQCPSCHGAVIVPLATATPAVLAACWGPPPLPANRPVATGPAAAPLGKWQQRGRLAGVALLFGGLFLVWMLRWLQGEWPWSPRVSALEIQLWFTLGVAASAFGIAYTAQFTDSLPVQITAGCIIPVLVVGFCWSALGVIDGGCSAGCASNTAKRQAGIHTMFVRLLWFGGIAFLWAIMYGWLYALKRR